MLSALMYKECEEKPNATDKLITRGRNPGYCRNPVGCFHVYLELQKPPLCYSVIIATNENLSNHKNPLFGSEA